MCRLPFLFHCRHIIFVLFWIGKSKSALAGNKFPDVQRNEIQRLGIHHAAWDENWRVAMWPGHQPWCFFYRAAGASYWEWSESGSETSSPFRGPSLPPQWEAARLQVQDNITQISGIASKMSPWGVAPAASPGSVQHRHMIWYALPGSSCSLHPKAHYPYYPCVRHQGPSSQGPESAPVASTCAQWVLCYSLWIFLFRIFHINEAMCW